MADVNLYTQQLSSNLLEREKEVQSLHLKQISNSVLKYDFTFSHISCNCNLSWNKISFNC